MATMAKEVSANEARKGVYYFASMGYIVKCEAIEAIEYIEGDAGIKRCRIDFNGVWQQAGQFCNFGHVFCHVHGVEWGAVCLPPDALHQIELRGCFVESVPMRSSPGILDWQP
jgi:hypothetical protein